MPSFRVYVDMGTEEFANGAVVYTSSDDGAKKTCIDNLKNNAHYRFSCRCGCGAQFAGFGRDIKASGKIGRSKVPPVNITSNTSADVKLTSEVAIITQMGHGLVDDDSPIEEVQIKSNRSETPTPPRPFVSDRYLKKAVWSLSDDEIDAYHSDQSDPLEAKGVNLSERKPPAIGDAVYSIATGDGPFTLLDYVQKDIKFDDDRIHKVLCGLLRAKTGKPTSIPLADLALHYAGRPATPEKSTSMLWPVMMIGSSILGSAVAIGFYIL